MPNSVVEYDLSNAQICIGSVGFDVTLNVNDNDVVFRNCSLDDLKYLHEGLGAIIAGLEG